LALSEHEETGAPVEADKSDKVDDSKNITLNTTKNETEGQSDIV